MKVLLIGSGGREHAIAWKLKQSPLLTQLYCSPGNPGTALLGENIELDLANLGVLALWAVQNEIDLTVVGPEAPLAGGIVNIFEQHGVRVFGPSQEAAALEISKSFSKDVMVRAGVKTARAKSFSDKSEALVYLKEHGAPVVIKADGLAAGKGVTVAHTMEVAEQAVNEAMERFGDAGKTLLIEDMLVGREASVMAIVDGESVLPLAVSQDYKRLKDNDEGPNTGGMGAVSPTPVLADDRVDSIIESVFLPVIGELLARGIVYRGFLYAGLMVDEHENINVLEFNCRLGDPQTQVLMMRLQSDLLEVLNHAVNGTLANVELQWSRESAVCVVASSKGYPVKVEDGKAISGEFSDSQELAVFQAGTAKANESAKSLVTKGGRVLSVNALGSTTKDARERAYALLDKISFDGMHYRTDIGK